MPVHGLAICADIAVRQYPHGREGGLNVIRARLDAVVVLLDVELAASELAYPLAIRGEDAVRANHRRWDGKSVAPDAGVVRAALPRAWL